MPYLPCFVWLYHLKLVILLFHGILQDVRIQKVLNVSYSVIYASCYLPLLCCFSFYFRKNKSFRPRERGKKGLKNLQTVKTLAGRTQSYSQQPGKARKQPMTVTAQFQQSLHSLMDTLNQANPFFIRCIKSNGDKVWE